jgi:uncharacterized protein (TIGR01319 family)
MTNHSADTILAADFGSATTRVSLFDVVEGTYRFVASGEAPSTLTPPYSDASEGMRHALEELHAITGRTLLNELSRLRMPATPDGSGIDTFVVTSSGGPMVRAVLVGLLPDVSLEAARRIAASSYVFIVDTFSLGDRRREEQQLDALLAARPNLIIIAGGTEGGSREALLRLVETVSLACHLLPSDSKPKILYIGNTALHEKVQEVLGESCVVHFAPNVLPELGQEAPGPARAELASVLEELRLTQIGGFHELAPYAGGRILPTAQAEGQIVRFLSRAANAPHGVLSVNVGSGSTSITAAFSRSGLSRTSQTGEGGGLFLTVRPDLGVGLNAAALLTESTGELIARWVPFEISEGEIRDFILNKSAHPHTVPAEANDLYLEQALAREAIRLTLQKARTNWPRRIQSARSDILPKMDLIVGGGAVLGQAPNPGAAALILLDALQPTGVTTLVLDSHHILAALGAAAYVNPLAVVQALDTGSFLTLGTAISVLGLRPRLESVVGQARLVYENNTELSAEMKGGSLEVMPLPPGQAGKLTLKPHSGIDVGFGPGRGRTLDVTGGVVGVILDARGRALVFPDSAEKRHEAVQQWNFKLGGV